MFDTIKSMMAPVIHAVKNTMAHVCAFTVKVIASPLYLLMALANLFVFCTTLSIGALIGFIGATYACISVYQATKDVSYAAILETFKLVFNVTDVTGDDEDLADAVAA